MIGRSIRSIDSNYSEKIGDTPSSLFFEKRSIIISAIFSADSGVPGREGVSPEADGISQVTRALRSASLVIGSPSGL